MAEFLRLCLIFLISEQGGLDFDLISRGGLFEILKGGRYQMEFKFQVNFNGNFQTLNIK
jgi:hypothetical protein